MKKNYFWSPHIDPQIATLRSVSNSLNSLSKYKKKSKNFLINVFGEWDEFNFNMVDKIDLISSRNLKYRKFKGFFNSRFLYFSIFFLSYFSLKKILNKNKPDHLIVHLITSIPISLFIFNKFKTELILRISGYPKLNFLRFLLWKIGSSKIKYVICPTDETKNLLLKKNIFKKNQLVLIPDPILNIKKINVLKRKKLENKPIKPFFLSVGRFTKQKNHIFLLNFFSKNSHYLKDTKLIIIGQGELESSYNKIIKDKKLEGKVEILGYKKNIFNYIYNAKCVISCSLWEDPGFVMVETAYVGTPIISSNCPSGPKEFIGKNENGFIFNSNDEDSFREALDNFITSSKDSINQKLINAKKRSKIYTCFHNSKKLSNIGIN
tara:strand:+ start:1183 stop:2316 length:1134 start_codon:yes stop_codon:yes gene_type:complete